MLQASQIKEFAKNYFPQLVSIRRHIHKYPELSFQEFETSKFIQEQLKKEEIDFTAGHVKTGIVALIKGKQENGKTILLRADMDALPIEEKNNTDYKSCNTGVMHACGHDVHTTCALGAAFILNKTKHLWSGTVKIMFQPGEEVLPGGASLMIEEGVLQNPKVDKAIALHVFPSLEAGKLGFKAGKYMASTDELYITVNGKGGHAAVPEKYVNPLIIASEILLEIDKHYMQNVSEEFKKQNPTVIAFGKIEGKGATNIIPEKVEIAGTLRTMNETWRKEIHQNLKSILKNISNKYGIESTIEIKIGYPFLINEENFTNDCTKHAKEFIGNENVIELPIRMTAEDFAFISQKIPSCFFRLGTGFKNKINSEVHTSTFDIDESAIELGAAMMAWLAMKELS